MLQSTSQMAKVQEFLAIEGCDWKFIPPYERHSEIHEVTSATNIVFSCCHFRGTVHITYCDRGLSKFQTPVCLIWWSFQPNMFVHWTFSNWWTTYTITCCWLYWCQTYSNFQVANLPTSSATILAAMVFRQPPDSATASTLAEDI